MTTFKEAQRVRSKPVARSGVPRKFGKTVSKGEALLENHLNALKIPFTREFKFHPQRKWQADFRIDDMPILVERAACDFLEYMDRPPLPLTCYVDIPAGPDYYVPEIDGYDDPAEIMKY